MERQEPEITPEMIEAGVEAAGLFKPGEDDPEMIVREVFSAMRAAQRQKLAAPYP